MAYTILRGGRVLDIDRGAAEPADILVEDDTIREIGPPGLAAPEGARAVWQEFYPNPGPAKFRRSLRLGASVDASKVEAVYRNGLLVLTLPKTEYAKPRQIQVKVTSGDDQ